MFNFESRFYKVIFLEKIISTWVVFCCLILYVVSSFIYFSKVKNFLTQTWFHPELTHLEVDRFSHLPSCATISNILNWKPKSKKVMQKGRSKLLVILLVRSTVGLYKQAYWIYANLFSTLCSLLCSLLHSYIQVYLFILIFENEIIMIF